MNAGAAHRRTAPSLGALSILVVDDNAHMRQLASALLKGFGLGRIYEAESADAAWTVLEHSAPDIVLVDFDMPELSGADLIKRIRKSHHPHTAVILMTAFSDRRRVLAARDAGASEIVAKPLTIKSLLDRIIAVIDRPRPHISGHSYCGPDRRRRADANYRGPLRRASDLVLIDDADPPPQRAYR